MGGNGGGDNNDDDGKDNDFMMVLLVVMMGIYRVPPPKPNHEPNGPPTLTTQRCIHKRITSVTMALSFKSDAPRWARQLDPVGYGKAATSVVSSVTVANRLQRLTTARYLAVACDARLVHQWLGIDHGGVSSVSGFIGWKPLLRACVTIHAGSGTYSPPPPLLEAVVATMGTLPALDITHLGNCVTALV